MAPHYPHSYRNTPKPGDLPHDDLAARQPDAHDEPSNEPPAKRRWPAPLRAWILVMGSVLLIAITDQLLGSVLPPAAQFGGGEEVFWFLGSMGIIASCWIYDDLESVPAIGRFLALTAHWFLWLISLTMFSDILSKPFSW